MGEDYRPRRSRAIEPSSRAYTDRTVIILGHGSGFDDLLLILVPVVFIVVFRLFRGSGPPEDRSPPEDERAPR